MHSFGNDRRQNSRAGQEGLGVSIGTVAGSGRFFLVVGAALALLAQDVAARPPQMGAALEADSGANRRDELNERGKLLAEIGKEATQLVGGVSDGIFLYAEMADGLAVCFLQKSERKAVRMYLDSLKLRGLIEQAWRLESSDPRKRWIAMEYDMRGHSFDAHYVYPKQMDAKAASAQRAMAALSRRFAGMRLLADRRMIQEIPDAVVYSEEYRPILISPP